MSSFTLSGNTIRHRQRECSILLIRIVNAAFFSAYNRSHCWIVRAHNVENFWKYAVSEIYRFLCLLSQCVEQFVAGCANDERTIGPIFESCDIFVAAGIEWSRHTHTADQAIFEIRCRLRIIEHCFVYIGHMAYGSRIQYSWRLSLLYFNDFCTKLCASAPLIGLSNSRNCYSEE